MSGVLFSLAIRDYLNVILDCMLFAIPLDISFFFDFVYGMIYIDCVFSSQSYVFYFLFFWFVKAISSPFSNIIFSLYLKYHSLNNKGVFFSFLLTRVFYLFFWFVASDPYVLSFPVCLAVILVFAITDKIFACKITLPLCRLGELVNP